jgi:hypothetical protein
MPSRLGGWGGGEMPRISINEWYSTCRPSSGWTFLSCDLTCRWLFPEARIKIFPYSCYSMGLACKVSLLRHSLRSFFRSIVPPLFIFCPAYIYFCSLKLCLLPLWSFHLSSVFFTSFLLLFASLILPLYSFFPLVLFIFLYALVFFNNKLSLSTVRV